MAADDTIHQISAFTESLEEPDGANLLLRPQEPCAFVIFGASGDLTGRKLIPALYNLSCQELLPGGFAVIGFALTPMDDESFRETMRDWVQKSPEVLLFRKKLWDEFAPCLHYITADFERADGYQELVKRLQEMDADHGCGGNHLFYCATPPSFYPTIVENMGKNGLAAIATPSAWTRIIVEKPFGRDLASAQHLNIVLHRVFDEEQIYRIDHYLGKETVQNLLAFRFANSIIEPIWNQKYIDHVQITAAESLGVEHRAKYYEESGALRDMFQNHLLQLLALIAMEPPVHYDGRSVRDRKADVLRSLAPLHRENLAEFAVRGQYGEGSIFGVPVPGYREEEGVAPESDTETYVALKLMVDNWRWADVPFYVRSGKRMPKKLTEIVVQFKRVPHFFFPEIADNPIEPNRLIIRIQPDEGIALKFGAKIPGQGMRIQQVRMEFSYTQAFGEFPATAYETLLLDAMEGDPTLFNRSDSVELAWKVLAPVQESWATKETGDGFPNYAAGKWGPAEADALLARDGRAWHEEARSDFRRRN